MGVTVLLEILAIEIAIIDEESRNVPAKSTSHTSRSLADQ